MPTPPDRPDPPPSGANIPPGGERHFFDSPDILRLSLPWGNGVASARALAELLQVYANEGSYQGVELFSRETFAEVCRPRNDLQPHDRILTTPALWGLGVPVGVSWGSPQCPGPLFGETAGPRTVGHGGGHRVVGWADPDLRLSVAFVSASAGPRTPYARLADEVRAAFTA